MHLFNNSVNVVYSKLFNCLWTSVSTLLLHEIKNIMLNNLSVKQMHFDLTKSPKTNGEKKNSLLWIDLLLVNVKLLKAHCKGKCINKNLLANVGLTTKQLMKRECHSFTWKKVLSSHSILL